MDFDEFNNMTEDVEYLGALKVDTKKKCASPFKFPTSEETKSFRETLKSNSPEKLSTEHICSGSLGFYLYTAYLQTNGDETKARFLVEVANYRKSAPSSRLNNAMRIMDVFVSKLPLEYSQAVVDPALARNPVKSATSQLSANDLAWSDFLVSNELANNPIGIEGYPPEIVRAAINQASAGIYKGLQLITADIVKANKNQKSPLSNKSKRNSLQIIRNSLVSINPRSSFKTNTVSSQPINRRYSSITAASITGLMHTGKVSPDNPMAKENTWPSFSAREAHRLSEANRSQAIGQERVFLKRVQEDGADSPTATDTSNKAKQAPNFTTVDESSENEDINPLPDVSASATAEPSRHRHSAPEIYSDGDLSQASSSILPCGLFDQIEGLVFQCLKEKHSPGFLASLQLDEYLQFSQIATRPVSFDDFSLLRTLGRGGFGTVSGCSRKQTGKLYAMKVMNKKRVKSKRSEILCLNERDILVLVDSPFVVCLRYAFTTPADLYLILDLMSGGDLRFHLMTLGSFPNLDSKYYSVRTVLGIGALHKQSIAYRDLKPENILMSSTGVTKISDLGLAVVVRAPGLQGACGTRGYQPPEMLSRNAAGKRYSYNETVDWFAMGCCIAEFLQGTSPYSHERVIKWSRVNLPMDGVDYNKDLDKDTYKKVYEAAMQEMEPDLDVEKIKDPVAIDIIQKLLRKDPLKRLGSGPTGFREILAHEWFNGIDISSIEQEEYDPPFVPSKDINMLSQDQIGTHEEDKTGKNMDLSAADQAVYEKWDFLSDKAFEEEVVDLLLSEAKNSSRGVKRESKRKSGSETKQDGCCTIT